MKVGVVLAQTSRGGRGSVTAAFRESTDWKLHNDLYEEDMVRERTVLTACG